MIFCLLKMRQKLLQEYLNHSKVSDKNTKNLVNDKKDTHFFRSFAVIRAFVKIVRTIQD